MKEQGLLGCLLSKCEFVPMWTLYSLMCNVGCKKPLGNAENCTQLNWVHRATLNEQTSHPASDPSSPHTLRRPRPRHNPPSWVREPSSQHFKITQAVVNPSGVHIHRPSGPFQGKCHIYWNISVCLSHLACVKLSYYSYKATMFIKKTKQNICQWWNMCVSSPFPP